MLYLILFSVLSISVLSDFRTSKIPNAYVLCGVISGLMLNTVYDGLDGLKSSVLGIVLPVFLLCLFFYARLLGAGDIKLFCAIGALMGWKFGMYAMAYSFVAAGAVSMVKLAFKANIGSSFLMFYKGMKISLFTGNFTCLKNRDKIHIIRLSPAISAGVCIQLLLGSIS